MTTGELRRSMAAGIAFVVLFVVGTFASFGPNIKKHDTPDGAAMKYLDYVSKHGNRVGLIVSAYVLILAGIALIWFTQGLRRWGGETIIGGFVGALGVLGAAAMSAAGMAAAVVAGSVSLGDTPLPSKSGGDAVRVVMDLTYPFLFVVFGLVAAAIVAATAIGGLRAGLVPRWLAYLAFLAVLGGAFAVFFLPMALPLLWILALAIVGLTRAGASSPVVSTTT
jgi:hypothetical protein